MPSATVSSPRWRPSPIIPDVQLVRAVMSPLTGMALTANVELAEVAAAQVASPPWLAVMGCRPATPKVTEHVAVRLEIFCAEQPSTALPWSENLTVPVGAGGPEWRWASQPSRVSVVAFVNGFGSHAPVLAIGNVLSFTGCLTAVVLVWRDPAEPEAAPVDAIVTDLHTQEFVALREAVIAEHERRTGDLQLAAA